MKKLITLMIGLTIALGGVAIARQDTTKTDTTAKKKTKKTKKKAETTKSGGSTY
jgi:hypothetical protein